MLIMKSQEGVDPVDFIINRIKNGGNILQYSNITA